jgi:hypothetical protein
MAPELVKEFIRAYHAELNTLRANQEVGVESDRRELSDIERKLTGLIDAIADGLRAPGLQDRLDQLTNRKSEIQQRLEAAVKPMPRLHPRLADVYREQVVNLQAALADPATHDDAMETMRGLVEKVIVRNTETGFEIELVGEIANMLTFSGGPKSAEFRSSVKVVAGPRYHLASFNRTSSGPGHSRAVLLSGRKLLGQAAVGRDVNPSGAMASGRITSESMQGLPGHEPTTSGKRYDLRCRLT